MKPIESYTDPKQLRILMGNAKKCEADEVYWSAFKRLCEVSAIGEDQLTRDFNSIMTAYEELLSQKSGKTIRAGRTWPKAKKQGIVKVLQDWADSKQPASGFNVLAERDLLELTGEHLVVKYASLFPEKTVENANKRLKEAR